MYAQPVLVHGVALAIAVAVGTGCEKKKSAAKVQPVTLIADAAAAPAAASDAAPTPATASLTPALPAGAVGIMIRSIDPKDPDIVLQGLPAISSDGATVALPLNIDDGDRGYPGLKMLLVAAKTGATVREWIVVDPKAISEAGDSGAADPEAARKKHDAGVASRVAEVNAALAGRTWRPMAVTKAAIDSYDDAAVTITVKDVVVVWASPHLTVTRGGKKVYDRAHRDLVLPPAKDRNENESPCDPRPVLSRVLLDDPATTAVIVIGYRSGHHCTPPDEVFVVAPLS